MVLLTGQILLEIILSGSLLRSPFLFLRQILSFKAGEDKLPRVTTMFATACYEGLTDKMSQRT